MGLAGAYYMRARTWPQLIDVSSLKNRGVLNFGLRVCKQWRETNMQRYKGNRIVFITN